MYFVSSCKPAGERYGEKYFYKWWKRACENLGIEGLDLYGGTRHTTISHLGRAYGYTREQLRARTHHSTNKALERYLQNEDMSVRTIYEHARNGKGLVKEFTNPSTSNLP